jgi:hypothetical protein
VRNGPAKDAAPEAVDDIAGDLVDKLVLLVRRDLELAAARRGPEVRNTAREAAASVVSVAGLFLALAVVTFAIEQALTLVVRPWLAAAIVAAAWVCVAGLLLGFDLPWRLKRRLDRLGTDEAIAEALAGRAEAEAEARDAAARFARALATTVAQDERDELVRGAQHLREEAGHDAEVVLRDVVSALLKPGRAGIGLLESLADRGRSSR